MTGAALRLALRRFTRRMYFRASIYAVLGIATALLAALFKPLIPESLAGLVGADSVGNLLTILASSMLAVTTFSLSIMVSAYSSASSGATPRATRLLIADSSAQNALATFIGAFLFSVVGLIALSTGVYGESGRVVLFAATVLVICVITMTLLRWIDQLSSFGRLGATIELVESVTARALADHLDDPLLGAVRGSEQAPEGATPVSARQVGYVEYVDVALLSDVAEQAGGEVHVCCRPGALTAPDDTLAWFRGPAPGQDVLDRVRAAFTMSSTRSFEQDPRYGFVVLTEIGSRALSSATNDPGTAIEVLVALRRLLCTWATAEPHPPEPRHPRVSVPAVETADLFDDIFPLLARDGAPLLEIAVHIQKCLAAVAASGRADFAAAARRQGQHALERSLAVMTFGPDRQALMKAAAWLEAAQDGA